MCTLCMHMCEDPYILSCGHNFHHECLNSFLTFISEERFAKHQADMALGIDSTPFDYVITENGAFEAYTLKCPNCSEVSSYRCDSKFGKNFKLKNAI